MAQPDVKVRISAVDETKAAFNSVARGAQGLKNAIFSVQGAIAGIAGGAVISGLVKTNASFQRLQASLQTFTGSAEAAAKKFEELQTFAAKTPFSLQEIVEGFNILKARGLDPSIESFNAFGNIASGTGKTLNQFTEALADAAVGEFERLKEFGIKANKEGDRIKFTFGGVATEVGNNSQDILGYLEQLGNVQFSGAMARQANTLDGAFSNFGDAVDALAKTIGESGLNKFIVEATRNLTGMISRLNDATKAGLGFVRSIQEALGTGDLEQRIANVRSEIQTLQAIIATGGTRFEEKRRLEELIALQRELNLQQQKGQAMYPDRILRGLPAPVAESPIKELTKEEKKEREKHADWLAGFEEVGRQRQMQIIDKRLQDQIKANQEWEEWMQQQQQGEIDHFFKMQDQKEAKVKSFVEETQSMYEAWGRGFTDVLTSMVTTGKGSFRDLANSIISDLIRIQIQKRITDPLVKMGSSFLDSIFAPAAAPAATPSFAGGGFTGIGARSGGLDGQGGFMAMLHPNETVVDHTKGQGMGGVVVNQTINVTTGVQQTVRAEILTLMPQIANAAKSAVADAKLRGGSYAAALR